MNDKASQGTFLKPNVAILIDVLKKQIKHRFLQIYLAVWYSLVFCMYH